jgi:hypothetical protein
MCDPVAVGEDGWSEWLHPTAPSFLSQCCDCGLVHETEFEIVPNADNARLNPGESAAGIIIFRVRRSDASAIEARQSQDGETRLGPKGKSAAPQEDAQDD